MLENRLAQIEDFEQLTLSSQLEHLAQALETQPAIELIQLCAPIRDPAPLAWLSKQLLERGWFCEQNHQEWFANFLIALPETAVDKLLKAMVTTPLTGKEPCDRRHSLCQILLLALRVVPLKALSSMCLIDRTLKHHFPEERDAHLNQLFHELEAQITSGQPDAIPLSFLAQMTSTAVMKLEETAASINDRCLTSFQKHRKNLAQEAIQILEDAPKAVSQANAEDLLARRVYTDPGHFLIELLQNAEDSGAKVWRVLCDRDKMVIWHDGIPFDTRDLVGITSIGQTTKRKQQIGFFGVGFKSVYEVTDRPQIYSDVYNFEIADVSIPKLLAQRPSYLPPTGTAVVLPLRANLDNERSPSALYEKGAALDSCVLLTLRSIEEIEFRLTEAAGGPSQHTLIECASESGTTIRHEPSGNIVDYLIQDDEYTCTGIAREAGRPDSTKVMVGILRDASGLPHPLPETAAEVYSYLPTREQPGLRFFVQGHFDVPVDRERIAPDSLWNRWIVSQVPHQLARIAQRIANDENFKAAAGFIDILPLKRDLPNAPFAQIPTALPSVLNTIAFVPVAVNGGTGKLVAPINTIVAEPQIVSLFENDQIGNERFFLDSNLSERHRAVLLELGAANFSTTSLIAYLEKRLTDDSSVLPNFIQSPAKLEVLYDLLLTELELLDRQGEKDRLDQLLKRLKSLPLVPDSNGKLRSSNDVVRGSALIRRIYEGTRHFIDPRLESSNARTFAFFDRIDVVQLDLEYLVSDLETSLGNLTGPLQLPRNTFPSNEACLEKILEAFVSADYNVLQRVARLPLFRSANGKFYPMAINTQDETGVLNASNPSARDIAEFYGTVRPIAEPRINETSGESLKPAEKSSYQILLDRLPVPGLTLAVLADDLESDLFETNLDTLQRLHELLENHVDDISDKVSKQLVQLAIWPDRNANPRALSGNNRVFIPADDTICEIFPRASFLDKIVSTRKHTLNISIPAISVNHVIEGLTLDAEPTLAIEHTEPHVDRALRYIHDHASRVDSSGIRTLKDKAVFLSDCGKVRTLSTLSKAESPELRAIYGNSDLRSFVDENGSSWTLIRELGLENSLISANVELLADDIEADLAVDQKLRDAGTGYRAILVYISKRVDKMTRQLTLRYSKFPIYPDTTGNTGSLSNERADRSPDFVYPASGPSRKVFALTAVRLLNAEIENIIRPLIIAAKIPEVGLDILVDSLVEHPITDEDALDMIQELFVDRKYELQQLFPHAERQSRANQNFLNRLPIWKTLSGQCKGASEIMGGNLSELFEPGTDENDELLKACIKPAALRRLKDLAPLMVPQEPESFLADLIKRTAKPGQPLSTQPYFLASIERVLRLYEVAGIRSKVELPSIDAAGNLTFAKLYYTDSDTLALLAGLPILEQVLHADLTTYFELLKEKPNQLSGIRNSVARFWNKVVSTHDAGAFQKLPPELVIAALPPDSDSERRTRFYRWLLANKISVFEDKNCVAKLTETPLFQTKKGNLVRPTDLVFDDDMPDLGIDWLPGAEIPKPLIDTLKIHLDVGRLNVDDLIRRHVVPAYEFATENGNPVQAGKLLSWLAKRLINRPESEVRRLLKGKKTASILLEASDGSFHLPEKLLLPAPEIRSFVSELWEDLPQPSELRYDEDVYPFLVSLGVSTSPNLDIVALKVDEIKTRNRSLALARIIYHLRQIYGEALFKKIPTLKTSAWLVDGDGAIKSPKELYVRVYEVETLVGPFADLYIDKTEEEILGADLIKALGFKDITSIQQSEILNHLEYRAGRKEPISQRAYGWLDQAADQGTLTLGTYNQVFANKPSILTDDGEYEVHTKVIGTRAFHLFGNLRGYWTRGWRSYPALCKLLGINEGTTPRAVQNFVEEVGKEVLKNGSKELLQREPALPLMLTSCFGILSSKGIIVSRDLPIIPAVHKQTTHLLPASTPGIYWSDTPTLEALFANVGKLYLARRSTTDDAENVDAFYTSMGVLRLRDTYKVVAAKREGSDRTSEQAQQILSLRQVLRGLVGVIPRIQLERELNSDTTWVYTKHLKALSASGSIKAIEHLKVRYVLAGVGEVEVDRPAAYDTNLGELLIDTKVLADPDLTGLSEGLLPAIIQGPSAEAFVDLFEILLARRTQDDMSAYLNRRHFAEAHVAPSSVDKIAQRIGELLDYGLADRLVKRFSVFDGRSVQKWREPALIKEIEGLATADDDKVASNAVKIMLRSVGVDTDEKDLEELMKKLLLAPSISDCSELLVFKSKEKTEPREEFVIRPTERNGENNSKTPSEKSSLSSSEKDKESIKTDPEILSKSSASTAQDGVRDFFGRLFRMNQADSKPKDTQQRLDNVVKINADSSNSAKKEEPVQLPSWLQGNYFSPSKSIPAQLWAIRKNAQTLESMQKEAFLSFSPGRLPTPYLYAVNTLGATFNPITQSWSFGRSAQKYFSTPGESSGRVVSFSGQFFAGKSRLPLPLYSRLTGPVTVSNGTLKSITHDEIGAIVELEGRGLLSIKYDVETLALPQLSADRTPLAAPDKVLVTPTVPLHTLPPKVIDWINNLNSSKLSEPKRALAAQDFVRGNYQYDGGFLDREDVKTKRATLPFLSGNHHIELLHASGDSEVLGRGVCYELNVLLVELLRHLKIPSFIATGWVLDEGVVDISDHLFTLALLNSDEGPCILPLDAAATERGPIRTVQRRSFPTPAKDLTSRPSIPTAKGSWNISPKPTARATEGGVMPDLDVPGPQASKKGSSSSRTPKPASKSENSFSWLFEPFKEITKPPGDSDQQKTVSKSLSDARIAQERSARKNLVDALEKERVMRQKAEAQLGEERKLRRIAEEQIKKQKVEANSDAIELPPEPTKNDLDFRITEPRRQADEFNLLCKAYNLTIDAVGLEKSSYPVGSEALRQKLIKLLGSSATVDTFLKVLRGELTQASKLTPELKFLEDLRLIELETIPTVCIHVIDGEDE